MNGSGVRTNWSPEERARAKELRTSTPCHNWAVTARKLNQEFHKGRRVRTAGAVKSQPIKVGAPPPVSEQDISTMKALAAKGLSAGKIARQMGVTRNTIIGRCNRAGVKLTHKQHSSPTRRVDGGTGLPVPETEKDAHTASMCQYIHGGLQGRGAWCMNPKAQGSYCQEHYDLCHNTGAPRIGWQ